MSTDVDFAPQLGGIDHFTICCHPAELPRLQTFYGEVLGLRTGPRPPFTFPGHWMYAGERALVHLAATLAEPVEAAQQQGQGLDHVSFRARGLAQTRARLLRLCVAFEELPVPDWPLRQIFLRDPAGTKLELTFEVPE